MNKPAPPVLLDLIDLEKELHTKISNAKDEHPAFIARNLEAVALYTLIFLMGFIVCKLFFN